MDRSNKTEERLKTYEARRKDLVDNKNHQLPYLLALPLIVLVFAYFLTKNPPIYFGATGISIVGCLIAYQIMIGSKFSTLKSQVKGELIKTFMDTYHPEVEYEYFSDKQQVEHILSGIRLVDANSHDEEDVIRGMYKNASFYFSEIDLENKSTDKDGKTSSTNVFTGILFDLKLPGNNFPETRIQSKRNLLQVFFSGFVKNDEYNLWYETTDEARFVESMSFLLPFISHLQHQQGDIRLYAKGDRLTLMMESKMNFLDEPRLKLSEPFDNSEYKANLAQQLNTLLFIVDAFVNDLDNSEVLERLELKAIELEKRLLK